MLRPYALSFVFLLFPAIGWCGDLRFKKHVINDAIDYSAAALIDVNQDGKVDVVCGGDWYESPNWIKHKAADVPRIGGRPDGFSHLPFDVNRDGWMDVITVNYRSRSIKWMEHPGRPNARWQLHTVVEPGPMETGRLVDVDGDGQLDLLPNGRNFAAWWEFRWKDRSEKGAPAWIRHDLPEVARGHGVGFGDIDGDGRKDIVGQKGWLKAPADARAGEWSWNPEFRIERGSIPMLVVDPDQDGDNDIVWCSAHGFGVFWLENAKTEDGTRIWHRHAIDTSWSQCHAPLWADLDGDGRSELITGKRYMAHGGSDPGAYDPLVAYRYQFNPITKTWNRWTITSGDRVGFGLDPKVGDIDNDGDQDLLACGRSGLYWLENQGSGTTRSKLENASPVQGVQNLETIEPWGRRRSIITRAMVRAHGDLPDCSNRVKLEVKSQPTNGERHVGGAKWRENAIRYQIEASREVSATLFVPNLEQKGTAGGIVCMFDPASSESAINCAKQLASLGHVCIVPEVAKTETRDAVMDALWQTIRAADVLQATPEVDAERIGFFGDATFGKLGLFVTALDQRFVATAIDTRQTKAWNASDDGYTLAELITSAAPRALRVLVDSDSTWIDIAKDASKIYDLRKAQKELVVTSDTTHDHAVSWLNDAL